MSKAAGEGRHSSSGVGQDVVVSVLGLNRKPPTSSPASVFSSTILVAVSLWSPSSSGFWSGNTGGLFGRLIACTVWADVAIACSCLRDHARRCTSPWRAGRSPRRRRSGCRSLPRRPLWRRRSRSCSSTWTTATPHRQPSLRRASLCVAVTVNSGIRGQPRPGLPSQPRPRWSH